MGVWRDVALYNYLYPDKVSQETKDALYTKWIYDLTHPKKKSGLGGFVKSFVSIPFDAIRSIGRGDIGGLIDAGVRGATFGTLGLRDKGLINLGAKASGSSSSGASMYAKPSTSKQSGLVSQLRQGKGGIGGGSYSSVAKNPLGGEAGKTGK